MIALSMAAFWSGYGVAQPFSLETLHNNFEYPPELTFTLGQAEQTIDSSPDQVNTIAEIGVNLWRTHVGPRHEFTAGFAYAQLYSNLGPNKQLHVASVMPQYRYHIDRPTNKHRLYLVLAVGPGMMSGHSLGERKQGQRFIFNDKLGIGTYLDKDREWALELAWRHFSNANLHAPNESIDIPVTLTLTIFL
jgi:hypothetical protein